MSHKAQRDFCKYVKKKYKHLFQGNVVDCGSGDVNGNNRFLYDMRYTNYIGIDLYHGANVDIVGSVPEVLERIQQEFLTRFKSTSGVDMVISTEMLEHDPYWALSLEKMYDVLKPGGLLLITAAGDGRPPHGIGREHDYYKNISNMMFTSILHPGLFKTYFLQQVNQDLQFYGVK